MINQNGGQPTCNIHPLLKLHQTLELYVLLEHAGGVVEDNNTAEHSTVSKWVLSRHDTYLQFVVTHVLCLTQPLPPFIVLTPVHTYMRPPGAPRYRQAPLHFEE